MIEIKTRSFDQARIRVPGSKSYTHRALIAASLAAGHSRVTGALFSRDTKLTAAALRSMGATISADEEQHGFVVDGFGGRPRPCRDHIYLENSGTSMRLLAAVAALGQGPYVFDGSARMRQRPMAEILAALNSLGIRAEAVNRDGCPPVTIDGQGFTGGMVSIDCGISSQYLSALLLIAPVTEQGLRIKVSQGPVSRPYVDLTLAVMRRFGIEFQFEGYENFTVAGGQSYRAGDYSIEPDCSQAGYFWAAAAISGAAVKVLGIKADSAQGDLGFIRVLEKMGCQLGFDSDGITVSGGSRLSSLEVDMGDMPDLVPTLAVVAAFAEGRTLMTNVAHLRAKESDRLAAVAAELTKMGIRVECGPDSIAVTGGRPHGAVIATYDDHRIAMSFSLAGLRVPGIRIEDEACVAKSFPDYWDVFDTLR